MSLSHHRTMVFVSLVGLFFFQNPILAMAGPKGPGDRVHPLTRSWLSGITLPGLQGMRLSDLRKDRSRAIMVPVTVRLRHPDDLRRLVAMEGSDIDVARIEGKIAVLGRVVSARITAKGLDRLSRQSWVERIEPDRLPLHPDPLWVTGAEIQAPAVWRSLDQAGLPITGKGVTIADIDSGIDIFHPLFFRADGGYFAWIDVNDNGSFDPGIDAVDLDGNGQADQGETLGLIDAEAFLIWDPSNPVLDTDNGTFEAGWDYLYADLDGNGKRDFGTTAGFGEQDPTYGEPLFLADDVNGNGLLDPGEKLVALKTSKIAAVNDQGTVYRRGENLIELGDMAHPFHGTGATGILVAGVPGLTKIVGIAPDADLLLGVSSNQSVEPSQTYIWAIQSGADVVLHEYAIWTGVHLDGSTNLEAMMDSAADQGVAQANPTGNLGGSEKACVFPLDSAGAMDLHIEVPQGWDISYVNTTFHWLDSSRALAFVLHAPTGENVDLGQAGTQGVTLQDGTTGVYAYRDVSTRGSVMFDLYIWGQSGQQFVPVPAGTWTLSLSDVTSPPAAGPMEVDGFVMDEKSGWGRGARFLEHVSEAHLIGFPATADSAISVAAYTGRDDPPFNQGSSEVAGQLRRYSCRGKRIDGADVMDIAAPDNPLSLASRLDYSETVTMPFGALEEFGGTSGASPHVAGAAALIKQAHPDWTGLQVRDAIRAGALVDSAVHSDGDLPVEDLWGAGKLRIYSALYGEEPTGDDPPTIQILESDVAVAQNVTIPVVLSDNEDQVSDLKLFWDLDYDGQYDLGPVPGDQPLETAYSAVGTYVSKVMVEDSAGNEAAALALVHVTENGPDAGPGSDGGMDAGTDAGADNGSNGGCGCRTTSQDFPGPAWPTVILFAGLWMLLQRRRRTRTK